MSNGMPPVLRRRLIEALGGNGPYVVRDIEILFEVHGFTRRVEENDESGARRGIAAALIDGIDWNDAGARQRFAALVDEVLRDYEGNPYADKKKATDLKAARNTAYRGASETVSARDSSAHWAPGRLRVFLSHAHQAAEFVTATAQALDGWGCHCFVAPSGIDAGTRWSPTIAARLNECEVLVAFIGGNFLSSPWCDQEVGWVLGRGVPVIPVIPANDKATVHGFMSPVQAVRVSDWDSSRLAGELMTAFVNAAFSEHSHTSPAFSVAVASGVVSGLTRSPSFDATRSRFQLLTRIPVTSLSDAHVAALRASSVENRQISQATTRQGVPVPDALAAYLS